MLTQSCPDSTSTTWSPVMARPMWAVTLLTPGISSSSLLTWVAIRRVSGREVPGAVFQLTRTSRSLNEGSSDQLSRGNTARPASATRPAARNVGRGAPTIRATVPS